MLDREITWCMLEQSALHGTSEARAIAPSPIARLHCWCSVWRAPGGSAPELVKLDVKPVVDLLVYCVILVADLLARAALLQRLCLGGSAILIGAADIDRVVPSRSAEAAVYVRGEDAADDVAEVRHVVDVW